MEHQQLASSIAEGRQVWITGTNRRGILSNRGVEDAVEVTTRYRIVVERLILFDEKLNPLRPKRRRRTNTSAIAAVRRCDTCTL